MGVEIRKRNYEYLINESKQNTHWQNIRMEHSKMSNS